MKTPNKNLPVKENRIGQQQTEKIKKSVEAEHLVSAKLNALISDWEKDFSAGDEYNYPGENNNEPVVNKSAEPKEKQHKEEIKAPGKSNNFGLSNDYDRTWDY